LPASLKDIKKHLHWLYDIVNKGLKKEILQQKKLSGWPTKWKTMMPESKITTEVFMSLWVPLDT